MNILKTPIDITKKDYQILINIVTYITIIVCLLSFIFVHFTAVVPTLSMYPTLQEEEFIFGVKTDDLEYGDIVTFRYNNEMWVKRLIGKPGDAIDIYNGYVFRNGEQLDEPYLNEAPDYMMDRFIVPYDSYFVMGDNRNYSCDSHIIGAVPAEQIIGRVIFHINPFQKLNAARQES